MALAEGYVQRDMTEAERIIIFITEFDVFKSFGDYKYTFRNTCDGIPKLKLGDGATAQGRRL